MKKEQEGIVIELNDNIAKVKVARHSHCENCGACPGSNAMIVKAINDIGAREGQKVIFQIKEDGMVKAAFIVYIFPLLLVIAGLMMGSLTAEVINASAVNFQVAGGIVGFMFSIVVIIYYEKVYKCSVNKLPKIIKIL